MIIRTKKYKLPTRLYIVLGLKNILKEQWWIFLIALGIVSLTFVVKTVWFVVLANIGLIVYFLFWLIQFYGITQLEQNKLIFERLSYEITSQQIMLQITAKQGMPIPWDQIKRVAQGKNFFLLIVSKGHIIYLPYKIFNNNHEIKFLETILKRKKLLS